jgi:large subunit ribosomal protein L4
MKGSLIQQDGSSQPIELADQVFNCSFNEPLVHQVTCFYAAGARQGTHAQKTRAEVRGGGKKPRPQKGTGRARAGSIRSPLWRGGGATFAVKPRDYSQKINKKMHRRAMCSILSVLMTSNRLIITDTLTVASPKTRELIAQLKKFNVQRVIIVLDRMDEMLYLASRNLPDVKLYFSGKVNPMDLIKYPHTIITLPALKKLEESLL